MERKMIVLVEDTKDKANYGFMAFATPDFYAKKAELMMNVTSESFEIMNREHQVVEVISLENLSQVTISLCSRIVSSSGFGGGLRTTVHIDCDFEMKDGTVYAYECVRPDTFEIVFDKLNQHNISINDPINVQKVYRDMEAAGQRNKYLSGNFGKLARKFKLDHPRRNKK